MANSDVTYNGLKQTQFEYDTDHKAQARALVRASTPVTVAYNAATAPPNYIDKRGSAMIAVWVPQAANGKTLTPLFARNAAGLGAKIPNYFNAGSYGAMPAWTISATDANGAWCVFQADLAPGPYIGFQFGTAFTGSIEVYLVG